MMFSIKNMFSPRGYPEDDLVTKGIPLISMCRHLEDSLDDWLTEELDNYLDDDYLVFDCPGILPSLILCLCTYFFCMSQGHKQCMNTEAVNALICGLILIFHALSSPLLE